jgi:predicted TIM-barrel fold metal-dependent hydrolase
MHVFEPAVQIPLARDLNDDLLAYCERRPERYRGLVSLPLADIPAEVAIG